jgi:YVTN family beta-propeller protein
MAPDGSRAYVGLTGADKNAVLDLGTLEVVSTIEPGEGPDGMAWVAGP